MIVISERPATVTPRPDVVPLGNAASGPTVVSMDDSPKVNAKRPVGRTKKEPSDG